MLTLKNNKLTKAFATILSANLVAQIIPFIVAPILTRLYTPNDFGAFAVIMSISSLLAIVSSAKFELSILVAKYKTQKQLLMTMCFQLLAIFTVFLFVLACIVNYFYVELLTGFEQSYLVFFIPLFVFLIGIHNILTCIANAYSEYKKIAINSIYFSVSNNIGAVLLAFISSLGMIYGFILGRLISVVLMLNTAQWKKQIRLFFTNSICSKKVALSVHKYRNFPIFSVPSEALDLYTKQMPIFLMGFFSGAYAVGLFALTERVLSKPLSIIGKAIALPFRNEAVKRYQEFGSCKSIVIKVIVVLAFISFVPFFLLYLYAVELFTWFFGAEWKAAGEFAQILVPIFFFQFITSPVTFVFHIAGKQKVDFYLHIMMVIVLTSCFLIGYVVFESEMLALISYSISYSLIYIVYIVFSIKFSTNMEAKCQP